VNGLTLADLEALARAHNPTLVQAQAIIYGQRAKSLEARLYPNPVVGYRADNIGSEGTAGEFQGGFVRQEIVTAHKRQLSGQKYAWRAKAAEANAHAQWLRVRVNVAVQYYRTLGRQRVLEIQRELLKSDEDNLVTARERYNVGQANRADVHRATAHLEARRLDVLMAENEYLMALEGLFATVGLPPAGHLVDELEAFGSPRAWDEVLQRVLAESPELAAARAKLREDQVTLQREQVEPIPNIFVEAATGYNFEAEDTVAGAQIYFELPLYDRNQGTILQARNDLARQCAEIRRIELELRRRGAGAYQRYLTGYQHVEGFRRVVLPQFRDAYEVSLKSYENRREDWPEVLRAQHDYFTARVTFTQRLVELREAEASLDGLLLNDGLQAANDPTPPGHIDSTPNPR
jgi:outer membrane protein TolC